MKQIVLVLLLIIGLYGNRVSSKDNYCDKDKDHDSCDKKKDCHSCDKNKDYELKQKVQKIYYQLNDLKKIVSTLKIQLDTLRADFETAKVEVTAQLANIHREQGGSQIAKSKKFLCGSGYREQVKKIKFAQAFTTAPHMHVALNRMDASNDYNIRLGAVARNITKHGFELVFSTWGDSIVYELEASWIAIGN